MLLLLALVAAPLLAVLADRQGVLCIMKLYKSENCEDEIRSFSTTSVDNCLKQSWLYWEGISDGAVSFSMSGGCRSAEIFDEDPGRGVHAGYVDNCKIVRTPPSKQHLFTQTGRALGSCDFVFVPYKTCINLNYDLVEDIGGYEICSFAPEHYDGDPYGRATANFLAAATAGPVVPFAAVGAAALALLGLAWRLKAKKADAVPATPDAPLLP